MRDVRVLELVSCFLFSVAYTHAGFANELSIGQGVYLGRPCEPDCKELYPKITLPIKKETILNTSDELKIDCNVKKTLGNEVHYPIKMWMCLGYDEMCFRRPPSACPDTDAVLICNESDSGSNAFSITYTKSSVRHNDSGTYYCVADTMDASFITVPSYTETHVTVKYFPLKIEIVSLTNKYEHISGEDIIIECHVSKVILQKENLHKLKMWFCDKHSSESCLNSTHCLRHGLNCTTSTSPDSASLSAMHIIKNAKVEDSGTYYCVAQADEEYIMPSIVNVSVEVNIKDKVPLKLKKTSLKSIVTRPANNVDLICLCNGYPEPSITWYQGDRVIQNGTKWYSLHNISNANEGDYYCVCKNRLEHITFTTTIDVKDIHGTRLRLATVVSLGGVLGIIVIILVYCIYMKLKKNAVNSYVTLGRTV
ncbi:vascular endothelial growth factor receptor 1-like [Anneissia japonica]|uniref:vascular endothelial growth factor receptor 1-like n=1 Tax=Anneissia japonica TaxID=1529436 RepID=UPI001425A3D7|nr:vascular endothelial growth factor receptor 1-like [Anneissia japonica]